MGTLEKMVGPNGEHQGMCDFYEKDNIKAFNIESMDIVDENKSVVVKEEIYMDGDIKQLYSGSIAETKIDVPKPAKKKSVVKKRKSSNQTSNFVGHKRTYYRGMTGLPLKDADLDYDSEGELDLPWQKKQANDQIDEFVDVNDAEKEIMKLWNFHIMKHGYVNEPHMKLACHTFIYENGLEVVRKNLSKNFALHMANLFDFGIISPETLKTTLTNMREMINVYLKEKEVTYREPDLKEWLEKFNQDYFDEIKMNEELKMASKRRRIAPKKDQISSGLGRYPRGNTGALSGDKPLYSLRARPSCPSYFM